MQDRAGGRSSLSGSHLWRLNCGVISPFGSFWSPPLSVVPRVSYWKAMNRNCSQYLHQMPQKCKMKPLGTDSESKPTNSLLRGSLLTCLVSICASMIEQLFLSFTWNLFIWPLGLPSGRDSSASKDLPQRTQNRSNCISS